MNKSIIVFLVFLLNGCFFYSHKDDCIYGLVSTQCFGELYPAIAHYQKPYSLGKTDAELRRKDIKSCGGFFMIRVINVIPSMGQEIKRIELFFLW